MPSEHAPIRRQPRLGTAHKSVRPALTIAPPPPPQHGVASAVKGYDAARQDRLNSDWNAVSRLSADAELQGKLPIIRDRFREFTRNEPLAKNFLNLVENNVVGDEGFSFESKVISSRTVDAGTGEEVLEYNAPVCRAVERAWGQFGHRQHFLTTRNMDMTAAWKLMARTVWGDGDCLLRLVRGYPNKFGFAVQLLEPDFLDDQFIEFRGVPCNCPQELTLPDGRPFPYCQRGLHQVRMGVELHGDWMFPLAYWILADHPGDYFFGNQYNTRRTRVKVEDIIHPFVFKRMGQTRGVSEMEAAMLRMQMLGGMDEAALVKARAAAQKIGVIERDVPDSLADQFAEAYEERVGVMDSEPGGMLELPMGYKLNPWDPQDPSPTYDPFCKRQTRMIAAAGGVSYTSLSNDIENVNFSSIRAGLLEEREMWKGRQKFFIAEVVRPIFEAWVPMAILSGQLDVPMSLVDDIVDQEAANFRGRRWPWVDPTKDVEANEAAVAAGFTSNTDVCAENGKDFEKVTASLGREKRMRAKEGLLPPEETTAPADPANPNPAIPGGASDAAVKFLKRDGWVTINGARVHIGDDGVIDKGPSGLVEHSQRRARSAAADKATVAAAHAENQASASPTRVNLNAAATAHREAEFAHVDAAEDGPRAAAHETSALAHRANAERLEKRANGLRRSFALPFAPTGSQDVLDHIVDQGGMMSRNKATRQGHPTVASDYDDAPELKGVYHHAVFGGTIKPDRMAHILHQDHGIGDGSIGGLYDAVGEAIQTRQAVQKDNKRQAEEYRQAQRFDKEAFTPHKGDQAVHVGSLSVGDTVVVHGEHMKVKEIDPDTMDVTLQDHSRYGAQRVSDNQVLYVEKVESRADDGPAVKSDGWVTIHGTHVHIGDDGVIDKGPAGLVEHSKERQHLTRPPARKNPMRDSVRMKATGDTAAAGEHALAAIDRVHDTGGNLNAGDFVEGRKAKVEHGHYDPASGEVSVAKNAPHKELTAVHEFGHKLHNDAFGFASGAGNTPLDRQMKPYAEAVAKLGTTKNLAAAVKGAKDKRIKEYLKYMADPKEIFARDYSHYVALRSGDAKLLQQVQTERADAMQYGHHAYRTDAEMEHVAAGFDRVFQAKGWR